MQQWVIRSEEPVKWGTYRDCKGWDGSVRVCITHTLLFNIQSDPCESSATREDEWEEIPILRAVRKGKAYSNALVELTPKCNPQPQNNNSPFRR